MSATIEDAFGLLPEVQPHMTPRTPAKKRSGLADWWHRGTGQIVVGIFSGIITLITCTVILTNAISDSRHEVSEAKTQVTTLLTTLQTVLDGEKMRNQMSLDDRQAVIEALRYLMLPLKQPDRLRQFERIIQDLQQKPRVSKNGGEMIAPGGSIR